LSEESDLQVGGHLGLILLLFHGHDGVSIIGDLVVQIFHLLLEVLNLNGVLDSNGFLSIFLLFVFLGFEFFFDQVIQSFTVFITGCFEEISLLFGCFKLGFNLLSLSISSLILVFPLC